MSVFWTRVCVQLSFLWFGDNECVLVLLSVCMYCLCVPALLSVCMSVFSKYVFACVFAECEFM